MEAEAWRHTWEVFHAALERTPGERAAFVAASTGDDEELGHQVLRLLEAHEDPANRVLDSPQLAIDAVEDTLVGQRIGPYLAQELIGEGGMGAVYRAQQEEPVRRQVALKVVPVGMDSREVVARFESERQALALMDHPNIAKVFDAGVLGDGRPFFVMELVPGIPISHYCDRQRLGTRERLTLFRTVCEAVQHAHQKGVVHRDLKPHNVLVADRDGNPEPKVIDFGVAKAVDEPLLKHGPKTQIGRILGTPEYMSPEQAAGEGGIDTRSDVYSLGVLLYELLTGTLPHTGGAPPTPAGSSTDGGWQPPSLGPQEPPTPSERLSSLAHHRARDVARRRRSQRRDLIRELRGDLDWITMKAMHRHREERYAAASSLAGDIGRHLRHEPVLAGPPSSLYRMRKFCRRHRVAVAGLSLIAGMTLAFVAAMAIQSGRVQAALGDARDERDKAERVSELMVDLFRASSPLDSRSDSVLEILDRGATRASRKLDDQPILRADLLDAIGRVYSHLGVDDRAEELLREAHELRRKTSGESSLRTVDSMMSLGLFLERLARFEEAEPLLRRALEIRLQRLGDGHRLVADSWRGLSRLLQNRGDLEHSEPMLRRALELRTRLHGEGSTAVAELQEDLAVLLIRKGDYGAAEGQLREALTTYRRYHGNDSPVLAGAQRNLGAVLFERGDYAAAREVLEEAQKLAERHLGSDHRYSLTIANNLALTLHHLGRYDQAEELYRDILSRRRRLHGAGHAAVVHPLNNLALLQHDRGDLRAAERLFREALGIQESATGEDHPDVAFPLNNLARVLSHQRENEESERLYRRALEIRRRMLPPDHPAIASSLAGLGELLVTVGDAEAAEPLLREALAIRRQALSPDDWLTAEAASFLGSCLTALERFPEAEPLLLQSYPIVEARRGRNYWRSIDARRRVQELYAAWNRPLPDGFEAPVSAPARP